MTVPPDLASTEAHPGAANLLDGAPEGNQNRLRHGLYSASAEALQPRTQELVDAIMGESHIIAIDLLGAREIARLIARIEAMDKDLDERGELTKAGKPRELLDLRLRASRRLAEWLDRYGGTPRSRAQWLRDLAAGSLAADIARRRREAAGGG